MWINSKSWDGVDRLQPMYETLTIREGFPNDLKEKLIYRWLLSCVVAAFMPSGFQCRGVLTIQGSQGLGKTRWIASLVDDELRSDFIKFGHHMDARNKDDIISAVSHWIVEIGELDSTFKKDVAALKGFLTNTSDKIRRPYGRIDSEYPRRTVFAATVNDHNFLVDTTGNTRFWVLPVVKINYTYDIDMQQLFAQLRHDYEKGEKWWLTSAEQDLLEKCNADHRSVSVVRETLEARLDVSRKDNPKIKPVTTTEVLIEIGFKNPTNPQCKECAGVLRELLGEPKRINGSYRWRVPFAESGIVI
ncbi:MAG: VapE domain-containing protein [Steroidobacteraceae bacterium]